MHILVGLPAANAERIVRQRPGNSSMWLVETVFKRLAPSNITLAPVANLDQTWLVTIYMFGLFFLILDRFLSVVLVFLLSSPSLYHAVSDYERESFQKIHGEKFEWHQDGW